MSAKKILKSNDEAEGHRGTGGRPHPIEHNNGFTPLRRYRKLAAWFMKGRPKSAPERNYLPRQPHKVRSH
ncbi:MAG TPA: hypothetical protein VN517_01815, partial [Terriglobales bacterium]|nr:hypothetical protein [Terriglobales bacterium]